MSSRVGNWAALGCVLALVAGGRFVCLAARNQDVAASILLALAYGVLAGGLSFWCTDLVLARGFLERVYGRMVIVGVPLLALAVFDASGARERLQGSSLFASGMAAAAVCTAYLAGAWRRGSDGTVHRLSREQHVPKRYLRRRPVTTAIETVFRLLPCPVPVSLYALGDPGSEAPIVVTGNYDLTVRRVARALANLDCRLLVCDSRGVNIWCASMAGHFGTDNIIEAIRETNLHGVTAGRRLILPQLCASSVSLETLGEAGFRGEFGPLDITDLPRYLRLRDRERPTDPAMRAASFRARHRVEMDLGSPLLLLVVLILIYNFLGLRPLALAVPFLYVYSVVHALVFPRRPIARIGWWASAVAAAVFLIQGGLSLLLFGGPLWASTLAISLGMGYLVTEFTGWSPLVRYSLLPRPAPQVSVQRGRCTGCERCVQVCPLRVFEIREGKSSVIRERACVVCRSCFSQCPAGAIVHSAQRRPAATR